jgi:hypothetical protein
MQLFSQIFVHKINSKIIKSEMIVLTREKTNINDTNVAIELIV